MKENFKKDMKQLFDGEVPDVLATIKSDPKFYVPEKESGFKLSNIFNRKAGLGFVGTFVVLLLVILSYQNFSDPIVASTVTIDLNPSIMITLDEDDDVIEVIGLNDDGESVIKASRRYRGWTVEDTIDDLVEILSEKGYIVTTTDEFNILLIEVDASSEAKRSALATRFEEKFNAKLQQYNSEHWVLDSKDIELSDTEINRIKNDPRLNKYTMAKMILIYRIHELDDSLSIDELAEMTVRELYDLYLSNEDSNNIPNYDKMPKKTRWNNSYFGSEMTLVV